MYLIPTLYISTQREGNLVFYQPMIPMCMAALAVSPVESMSLTREFSSDPETAVNEAMKYIRECLTDVGENLDDYKDELDRCCKMLTIIAAPFKE